MTAGAACAAVLDMGKTNVKLNAVTLDGHVLETVSTPNSVCPGPPWRHNDLAMLGEWACSALATMCGRHPIGHVIATGYGSGGVLCGGDPGGPNGGTALPMIDYEQELPEGIAEAYAPLAGSFFDRGSAIMPRAAHQARQLFWMSESEPQAVARARWYLGLPQYWAWLFSGAAASENSLLGAQSHLWNVAERRFSPIVGQQGWQRLMPPFAHAGDVLGFVRPNLAKRFELPATLRIHTGAHDSSANFYRYQAAGLSAFTVVSTGTWIVALADDVNLNVLDETRNMTLNSDVDGNPLGGALAMGGREFSQVAGVQEKSARADLDVVLRLVERGTFALPAFGADSGQFPGAAGQGRIAGPPPATAAERLALAVIYMALLTVTCCDALGEGRRVVLDGSYLDDPAYATLVASLRVGAPTLSNREHYGIASGAALLCARGERQSSSGLDLLTVQPHDRNKALAAYGERWKHLSQRNVNRRNSK